MGVHFALAGNPNVGKTAIFNALTGLSLTTGNYPGHTVEHKAGALNVPGLKGQLVDLPGSYSLAARSPDEVLLADVVLNQLPGVDPVDGLIVVADASNLERNLYFVSQLLELGKPTVLVLNMMDIAQKRGIEIDIDKLSKTLCIPVVPTQAHRRIGIDRLKDVIAEMADSKHPAAACTVQFPREIHEATRELEGILAEKHEKLGRDVPNFEAFRLLVDEGGYAEKRIIRKLGEDFRATLADLRAKALAGGTSSLAALEARTRYDWVRGVLDSAVTRPDLRPDTTSDKIDAILTHKVFGSLIFFVLMALVFQSIYTWAVPFMELIEGAIGALGDTVAELLPDGMLQSLVADGIIAGVGSVIVFLPQILLLMLFISILEDCGYMARAAFLMDKLLSWCGLSGQSFIPMMSSFACAIPGIMATRSIPNTRDRFTTILVAPLMSCSARLPVYVIMIAAFVPDIPVFGFFNAQGITLLAMYFVGITFAVPIAWTFKKLVFKGETPPFLLELPSYKMPQFRTVFNKLYLAGREFLVRAGTIIFAVTIIVWALAYFPQSKEIIAEYDAQREAAMQTLPEGEDLDEELSRINNEESGELLRNSFLGRAGRTVEPVFVPLGWDWRIATATIASFPAREVIIATLGTLFNLGADEDEDSPGLIATLRAATWPDGTPLFNIPVALSIMVFFALCCQCAATLAVIKRETGKWRWPAITFVYMTVLAYIAALITYQIGRLFLG